MEIVKKGTELHKRIESMIIRKDGMLIIDSLSELQQMLMEVDASQIEIRLAELYGCKSATGSKPMMPLYNPYDGFYPKDKYNKKKVCKFKCRSCGKTSQVRNETLYMCTFCNSEKIHELGKR